MRYPDPDKIKHFKIPAATLKMLNEQTRGFVLIYIDDKGEPQIEFQADNELTQMGLTKYIANKFTAIDTIEAALIRGDIIIDDEEGCGDPECPDCGEE
jgi:hypothetical protein